MPSIRPLKIVRPFLKHGEGSCLFQMGKTKVLCVATVEDRVPPHAEERGMGWVTAEYGMLPRAGEKRTARARAANGGRSQEISRLIGRSLRAVVDLKKLGPRTIVIDCDVLQADGGTRTASVNGGFLALVDALRGLYRANQISEWPVKDYLAAVSVGVCGGKIVADLCFEEDAAAEVDLNVVMTGSGEFVEIQGTAEGGTFNQKQLQGMLGAARRGIGQILRTQKRLLGGLKPPARKNSRSASLQVPDFAHE